MKISRKETLLVLNEFETNGPNNALRALGRLKPPHLQLHNMLQKSSETV
jgi:hypothetical protein